MEPIEVCRFSEIRIDNRDTPDAEPREQSSGSGPGASSSSSNDDDAQRGELAVKSWPKGENLTRKYGRSSLLRYGSMEHKVLTDDADEIERERCLRPAIPYLTANCRVSEDDAAEWNVVAVANPAVIEEHRLSFGIDIGKIGGVARMRVNQHDQ